MHNLVQIIYLYISFTLSISLKLYTSSNPKDKIKKNPNWQVLLSTETVQAEASQKPDKRCGHHFDGNPRNARVKVRKQSLDGVWEAVRGPGEGKY